MQLMEQNLGSLFMRGLILDPIGHLQATITLTSGQSKHIEYFTQSCLFYTAFFLSTVIAAGPRNRILFFCLVLVCFCDVFKRGNTPKGCFGEAEKSTGEAEFDALFACLLFYFATPGLCSDLFSFFLLRIIPRTAACSEGSDLLAKTPELTSDLCCENLTQMTTW